jgi:hypothetical protein
VTDVSHRTRIRETLITAIEGDDYTECGGDFYARGHIRSIAKVVGADPEPLIREYDSARLEPDAAENGITEPITPVGNPQRRRPPFWAVGLAAGMVAALGLTGFLLANPGQGETPVAGASQATPPRAGGSSHPAQPSPTVSPSPHPSASAATAPRILSPASAVAFGFAGRQGDHGEVAHFAIDKNPRTAWRTDWYSTASFGNLYPGTGLMIDMGRPVTINAVRIALGQAAGASLQLRVGSAPAFASLRPVAHAADVGGVVHLPVAQPARGRYVLVWFTRLPADSAGTFRESVYGLQFQGRI